MTTKYNFYSTLGAALLLLSLTASAESKPIASAEKKEKKEKAEKKEKSQKIKEFSDNYLQNKNTSDIIVTQLKQRK